MHRKQADGEMDDQRVEAADEEEEIGFVLHGGLLRRFKIQNSKFKRERGTTFKIQNSRREEE
jgi:hypothetical protein